MGTLGILVDPGVFRGIRKGRTGHERINLYNRAAAKHGLSIVYLSLNKIRPHASRALAYRWRNGKYVLGRHPIPPVIHNRAMAFSASSRRRLAWLNRTKYVYNAKTRYSKYAIHRKLRDRFANHLPVTVRYSKSRLKNMMERYGGLFIKPESGSVGKGILQLVKLGSGSWKLKGKGKPIVAGPAKMRSIVHRAVGSRRFLIQQAIRLANYHGRPYDIRVTVQRGGDGNWHVVGMFGKVARKGSAVTNVARGGTVKRTEVLLRNSFSHPSLIASNIRNLSLSMARHLGGKLNRLADVGLDIGVDETGKVYFIEMNARDQRYGFRKAGMLPAFRKTYENPVLYGNYLLRSRSK
jgi:glutathione synthase/RimK-type ligase-like ATP-grasp enzyme